METSNTLWNATTKIDGAIWDLQIVENAIVQGLSNNLVVIPNIDNVPIRLSLLALQTVRKELDELADEIRALLQSKSK